MGPGVPLNHFLAAVWVSAAVVLLFLTVRLYARLFRGARRLYWDDGLAILAAILVIITTALWQWVAHSMYLTLNVSVGAAVPPADFFSQLELWLRVSYVVQTFFYTTLTAVKLSLLFFFRRLGGHMDRLRYVWWPVLGLTLATWVTGLGTSQFKCLLGSSEYIITYCDKPWAIEFTTVTLKVNCALDVLTDVLILLIPIILVWGVQLHLRRKLAFTGLFSLTAITIIVSIVRAVGINASKWENGQNDPSYIWLWSAIEACIAIVVACLSSFPQLFMASSKKPVYTPSESFIARLRSKQSNPKMARHDPLNINLHSTRELSSAISYDQEMGYINLADTLVKPTSTYHHGSLTLETPLELSSLPRRPAPYK
ncbi:hypothetical protein QBC37DRAFT_444784 [Rhypophila decipiens]|uniref:Rhodopsin domain-containing protein n=1 Tax=Rhypophila decipiens TaxID=261697 RepID=A0AAN6XUG8_9PEZI|nr:hypothetical protein QBC37DRAFT_444784 [Rhypophila decipiens]